MGEKGVNLAPFLLLSYGGMEYCVIFSNSDYFSSKIDNIRILGLEADLSSLFWVLTGGRGLHTVHKCVVFHRFAMFFRYSATVSGDSVLC